MKGFQIFFEAVKSQFQSKCDVVVMVAHCMLVNELDCVSVGTGDQFVESDASSGSELLPTGWNSNQNMYSIKYRARLEPKRQFLSKGVLAGDWFIVTLMPMDTSKLVAVSAYSVSVKPDLLITTNWKARVNDAFVSGDEKQLEDVLRKEWLDKLISPSKTAEKPKQPTPLGIGPITQPPSFHVDPSKYPRIGGADIDPLNRGVGGGMIFDPFRPVGPPAPVFDPNHPLPPGAVPPGARFDPIGVPPPQRPPPLAPKGDGKSKQQPPNPDHFPPPGGFDPYM